MISNYEKCYNWWLFFREKIEIPRDKPYIILKGEGRRKSYVEWDDHDTTAQSPTFVIMADNIVVKSISFRVRIHLPFTKSFSFQSLLSIFRYPFDFFLIPYIAFTFLYSCYIRIIFNVYK